MRATRPDVIVSGDVFAPDQPHDRIMARSGDCVGMTPMHAVWRFGFRHGSDAQTVYGVFMPNHFLWVLATRSTGLVIEQWRGFAKDMPDHFRDVLDWEPYV